MATNMLPILLLGGAALFLMSRGGEDGDGGAVGEPIDATVETLGNVTLWRPSESSETVMSRVSYPNVVISSTGWSLEEISVRMKPVIEANPDINFLFAPLDVMLEVIEDELGLPMGNASSPVGSTIIIGNASELNGEASTIDDMNWDTFDEELAGAVEYIKSAPRMAALVIGDTPTIVDQFHEFLK